jgi:hypothetical protein
MRNPPTPSALARTAGRLQARSLASTMYASLTPPAVQVVKRAPKPGSVPIGLAATRVVQKPRRASAWRS